MTVVINAPGKQVCEAGERPSHRALVGLGPFVCPATDPPHRPIVSGVDTVPLVPCDAVLPHAP